jgi:hypothetical protein
MGLDSAKYHLLGVYKGNCAITNQSIVKINADKAVIRGDFWTTEREFGKVAQRCLMKSV